MFRCLPLGLLFLALMIGCGEEPASRDRGELVQEKQPPTSERTENETWKQYLPGDSQLVVISQPRRLLNNSEFPNLPWEEELERLNRLSLGSRYDGMSPLWLRLLGKELKDVHRAVYVIQELHRVPVRTFPIEDHPPEEMFRARAIGPLLDAYLFEFDSPVNLSLVKGLLLVEQEKEFAGQSYWATPEEAGSMAAVLVNPQTLILGKEFVVKKMLLASEMKAGPLTEALQGVDEQTELAAILHGQLLQGLTSVLQSTVPGLANVQPVRLVLELQLQSPASSSLEILTKGPVQAAELEQGLKQGIHQAGNLMKVWAPQDNLPAPSQRALQTGKTYGLELLQQAEVAREQAAVTLTLPRISQPGEKVEWLLGQIVTQEPEPQPAGQFLRETKLADQQLEILSRLPAAAGIEALTWLKLAASTSAPKVEEMTSTPLSLGLLLLSQEKLEEKSPSPEDKQEFKLLVDRPKPLAFAEAMKGSRWLGYVSLIQPEWIREFTCDIEGKLAIGVVGLQIPDLLEARFEYMARREESSWEITEFRFPEHHWTFSRKLNGQWSANGLTLNPEELLVSMERVSGAVTFQGKPLVKGTITFVPLEEGTSVSMQIEADGTYSGELKEGQYRVLVDQTVPVEPPEEETPQPEIVKSLIPEIYRSAETTPLQVEIQSGDNQIDLVLND